MTHLPFSELVDLDDAVLATYLDVLELQAKETKKRTGRRRGR